MKHSRHPRVRVNTRFRPVPRDLMSLDRHQLLRLSSLSTASFSAHQAHKMSLPVVKTIAECTDLYKTVFPYLPQLYDLPQRIFQDINNPQALKVLYVSTNPLISAFAFSLFLAPFFLLVSEVNKNYSQVDRCWSLLPTIYNAHFVAYAHAAGLPTRRLDILLLFSGVWSVRLPDCKDIYPCTDRARLV